MVALVEARRWLNENNGANVRLISVKEYDLRDCGRLKAEEALGAELPDPLEPEVGNVNALTEEILGFAGEGNGELCAHAVYYSMGIESAAELKRTELDCNSVGELQRYPCYRNFDELTAEGIRERCSYVWKEWLFFESTGATPRFMRMHSVTASSRDVWETLFWTFIYEVWGGYDCQYPFLLYKGLKERRFDRFLCELEKVRNLF